MKIGLDKDALNALFPEGSEARIELARAVTTAIVGKLALKDIKHLSGQLKMEIDRTVHEELRQQGLVQNGWMEHGSVQLNERARGSIRNAAVSVYNETIRTEVVGLFEAKRDEAIRMVEAVLTQRVEHGLKDTIKLCIKEVLAK